MYFEEFGTILREVAHFNIEYDRAYPALYAKLAPTMNRIKTYSSSGFYAGAYAADFLIFNCLDKNINLDPTSGNFLRVQGITFTQNTTKTLTVECLPLIDPFMSSVEYIVVVTPEELLYPDPGFTRVKLLKSSLKFILLTLKVY